MSFDDAAGRAAVELLIENGKLVPDFWLRAHVVQDWEARNQDVVNAVQFAMGKAGVELPEWARPEVNPPDCVWVPNTAKARQVAQEPYYSPDSLHKAFTACGDIERHYHVADKLSGRIWKRLVPHFNQGSAALITDIELERGNNGHTFSKRYRVNTILSENIIRDTPLYDFYVRQGEDGLKQVFHGIGQKAILGVGAMLFLSGEHDDLLYTAEQLSDELSSK